MGKYVFRFNNIAEYDAQKFDLIRPHIAYCEQEENIGWKRAVHNYGVEYVDLDLPSGALWAAKDLGAASPTEYGTYYAWGELTSKGTTYTNFTAENYRWQPTEICLYEKYNHIDGKTQLDLEDDVVNVTYGGKWHIPTLKDFQELYQNCTYSSGTFTSKNNGKQLKFNGHPHIWLNESYASLLSNGNESYNIAYYVTWESGEYGGGYLDIVSGERYTNKYIRPILK